MNRFDLRLLKKKKYKIIIMLLLILAVTLFIFSNSLKNRAESNQDSGFIISIIENIFGESDFDFQPIVRKGAHMIEFALLGGLIVGLIWQFNHLSWYIGYGLFYVLFVGVTDEFIQTFTDRAGMIQDVLIDFSGGFLGGTIVLSVLYIIRRKQL